MRLKKSKRIKIINYEIFTNVYQIHIKIHA